MVFAEQTSPPSPTTTSTTMTLLDDANSKNSITDNLALLASCCSVCSDEVLASVKEPKIRLEPVSTLLRGPLPSVSVLCQILWSVLSKLCR